MRQLLQRVSAAARNPLAWLAGAVVLGLFLRAYRLGHPPLWLDELTTMLVCRESWSDLLGPMGRVDVHPPYYYLLQKAWNVFGEDAGTMRLLNALLGTACIPVTYMIARNLVSARAAAISALLIATSPTHIQQSRDLRMYALLCLSVLIAIAGLAQATSRVNREGHARGWWCWGWAVYACGVVSAFYAQNSALFLPVLLAATFLILHLRGRLPARALFGITVANVAAAAAIAPWLGVLAHHAGQTLSNFWIPSPTAAYAYAQVMGTYPYARLGKVLVFGLMLVGFLALRGRPVARSVLAVLAVGQPVALLLISYVRPVMTVRAMVWPVSMGLMLVAAGIDRIANRTLMVFVCLLAIGVQMQVLPPRYPAAPRAFDGQEIAPVLSQFDGARDRMVLAFPGLENEMRAAVPAVFDTSAVLSLSYGDEPSVLSGLYRAQLVRRDELAAALVGAERIWFVSEIEPLLPIAHSEDVEPTILQWIGARELLGTWSVGNLRVRLVADR